MLLAKGPVLHTPSCFVHPGHKLAGGPAFRSLGRTQQNGCPTLRVLCEGWARCRMQRRFRHCPNPVLPTASYPPLPTTQGRGTHPYRSCRQLKGWATRPRRAQKHGHPPLLFLYPVTDQFPVTVGRPKPVDESNSFGIESKFRVNLGNPN